MLEEASSHDRDPDAPVTKISMTHDNTSVTPTNLDSPPWAGRNWVMSLNQEVLPRLERYSSSILTIFMAWSIASLWQTNILVIAYVSKGTSVSNKT